MRFALLPEPNTNETNNYVRPDANVIDNADRVIPVDEDEVRLSRVVRVSSGNARQRGWPTSISPTPRMP